MTSFDRRSQIQTVTAGCTIALFGFSFASAQTLEPPFWQSDPAYEIDITGYYLMTEFGGDPAFGALGGFDDAGYSVDQRLPDMDGAGIRAAVQREADGGWFTEAVYTGFFTEQTSSLGTPGSDNLDVHPNLHDRSLANEVGLDELDEGRADFATETIELDQHFGDLAVGRSYQTGPSESFWKAGLRAANTSLERNVTYLAVADDNDRSDVVIESDMWGIGPTIGAGSSIGIWPGGTLSASASASALYSHFDLSRRDSSSTSSDPEETRSVTLDTTDIVPVFDASIGLSQQYGSYYFSVGYTASAWLGGSKSISVPGWDDVNEASSAYTIRDDDLITHGVFARGGVVFGGTGSGPETDSGGTDTAWSETTIDITGYYLMTDYGGDPALGIFTDILGVDEDSYTLEQSLPDMDGDGIRASVQRKAEGGWFTEAEYTGFFTEETTSRGDPSGSGRSVHVNLFDRAMVQQANIRSTLDGGLAHFASESIELDQHFGDLVMGRSYRAGPSESFWKGGLRVANTRLDRDLSYIGGNNSNDRARVSSSSDMWGVGPTIGAGSSIGLWQGGTLSAAASASALYSHFDLSRRDSVSTDLDPEQSRSVNLNTTGIVPVFDSSIEFNQTFGSYYLSVGYTASAWFGGSKSISVVAWDDIISEASLYTIRSDDLITHGVFARGGIQFGGSSSEPIQNGIEAASAWTETTVDITGYYLMTEFGGDPAYGTFVNFEKPSEIAHRLPDMDGGGVRASIQRESVAGWFTQADYSGFFTEETSKLGDETTDSAAVHANLVDRALASTALDEPIIEGVADFARESIELEQHFGDLVMGRSYQRDTSESFWKGGLRLANTRLDRDVNHVANENDDTERMDMAFRSDMWGVGPTVGAGSSVGLWPGGTLSASASASALYSHFNLERMDMAFGDDVETQVREISLNTTGIVPVLDASIEYSQQYGNLYYSLGYTASAWLGGSKSISTPGSDDSDYESSIYTIRSDDLITHGVFLRGGIRFGAENG